MNKYRVSFYLVKHSAGGGKSTASASEIVQAETDMAAIAIATGKVQMKTSSRGREIIVNKVEKLK